MASINVSKARSNRYLASQIRSVSCSLQSQALSHLSAVPSRPFRSKGQQYSQTTSGASEAELASARKWLSEFKANALPRDIGAISFSRSSGPGGQNVNKVNSKAQLRVPVDRLFPRIPGLLHSAILSSRFYAEKSRSLLLQADDNRKQAANLDACYDKLHGLLIELAKDRIPGDTSQAQKEKVKKLQRSENEARLRAKKQHASKKASRSKSKFD